jgi:two-component system, chemotaxis family, chemotaxis protein CheY
MAAKTLISPLRGRLALVAEASVHTAELYARSLRSEGVGVLVAHSCASAFELLNARCFDLLVVDRDLPFGGAQRLLAHLRADRRHAQSRSIVCATEWTMSDRWMALLCGASVVLRKPVRSTALLESARALLPYRPHMGIAIG